MYKKYIYIYTSPENSRKSRKLLIKLFSLLFYRTFQKIFTAKQGHEEKITSQDKYRLNLREACQSYIVFVY